ncbi:MAG: cob(I)yrinic acid a,c-diamide adenosyltransferase [Acidobacteriota bacterium]
MKIYTRGGDDGETSLLGGDRVPKSDPRIEAYGTVDELNSFIGVVRASWPDSELDGEFRAIQNDLFDLGAQLAAPGHGERFPGVPEQRSAGLESAIDRMESHLHPLKNFILPGGAPAAAHLHVARTVCRRAERRVVSLQSETENANQIVYLNRLSDYLFVAARYANFQAGVPDVTWVGT